MSVNKEIVRLKFEKSIASYDKNAIAQQRIATRLSDIIRHHYPHNPRILMEIGCGTGLLSQKMASQYTPGHYYLNDINQLIPQILPCKLGDQRHSFIVGDAQAIDYPRNIDLLVSSSTIQWFEDLPLFISKAKQSMSADGCMFISTFGGSNLQEIRSINGSGLCYHSMDSLKALFEKQFTVIHAEEEKITLQFPSPAEVLRHLKATGVNGGFSKGWTKNKLNAFCEEYNKRFRYENGVSLTYHPIYLGVKIKPNKQ